MKSFILVIFFVFISFLFVFDTFKIVYAVECVTSADCSSAGACTWQTNEQASTCDSGWTNCVDAPVGGGYCLKQCSCAGSCTSYGSMISGSACINGFCSYSNNSSSCVYSTDSICNSSVKYLCSSPTDGNADGLPDGSFCNVGASYTGPSNITIYQGDTGILHYAVYSLDYWQSYSDVYSGCPTGAVCSVGGNGLVYEGPSGDEPSDGIVSISTTATTPPGTYPFVVNVDSGCGILNYTITIKPSRKTVCDNIWHEIPPAPLPYQVYSNPLALFNNGASNFDKYVKTTYLGESMNSCSGSSVRTQSDRGTFCRYSNGNTDTCTWELPSQMGGTSDTPGPFVCTVPAIYGWPNVLAPLGTSASVIDGGGRTFEVRSVPPAPFWQSKMEYKCSVPSGTVDLKVSNSAVGPYIGFPSPVNGPITANHSYPVTLTWTSNATACTVTSNVNSDTWSGANNAGVSTSALTANSNTYSISCNNGATDSVVINIPPIPPTGSASCNAAGNQITFNWTLPAPYPWAYVNMGPGAMDSYNCGAGSSCAANVPGTSRIVNVTPNTQYFWWLHTQDNDSGSVTTNTGAWSNNRKGVVTCVPSTMSGILTPASSSCTISSGASSCNIDFSWTTTNPVGTSAVTSNYPVANTTIANGNSGGPTPFTVPYLSSPRTFYLYNNAVLLDQDTVTSSCTSGTVWNGSTCAAAGGTCTGVTNVRALIHSGLSNNSRVVELEAWEGGVNYARPASGGTVSVSSELASRPGSGAVNGDRRAVGWETPSGGGWNDATSGVWDDWIAVAFSSPRNINEIDIYTIADSYPLASDPSLTDTFSLSGFGITSFDIQISNNNGASWATISNGAVTGNNKIWRQFACVAAPTPDLTAGAVTPTAATVGVGVNFTSNISNIGSATTGGGFYNFFRVATAAGGGGTISAISQNLLPTIASGGNMDVLSSSYTFSSGQCSSNTCSVQACADNDTSMVGLINEGSNEGNNCSVWTPVTVSAVATNPPSVIFETPIAGATVSGNVNLAGWALDNSTSVETAINNVKVYVDGVLIGTIISGSARPDICLSYPGRVGCPNVGYQIAWNSTSVGNGPHTIRFEATDSDSTPKTNFNQHSITVNNPPVNRNLNVIRSGQGSVTSNPAGINCGASCQASYLEGTIINLTATPAFGRIFTGWTGCDSSTRNSDGSGGTCRVTIGASDRSVTANFAVNPNYKEF